LSLVAVPSDHIAAIVTSLEMTNRPLPKPVPACPLKLVRWHQPDTAKYRALFERVGARWMWFSRAVMHDDMLLAIIHDPLVEVYAVVDPTGMEVGMLELDFRVASQAEIAFFGLITELAGKKLGRWLMAETLARAWHKDVKRVWVHTCTLDHPSALNFYRHQGFVAFERQVETFADPRISGALPETAAPHIPLLTRR
jgi:GNAT superfamily N-acetyltransferase